MRKGQIFMTKNVSRVAEAVKLMDKHLRDELLKGQEGKLWEKSNNFDKRERGEKFSLNDHIRGMILAMLSSQSVWARIEANMNNINEIFFGYNADQIMSKPYEYFVNEFRNIKCGNRQLEAQMQALKGNIEKLKSLEEQYGSIDEYYKQLNKGDSLFITLVKSLSEHGSKNKLVRLGAPLASEYLRHLGYDLPKPDRHICRVLGSKILGCSEKEEIGVYDAFYIIAEIAKEINKSSAEVDYILWSYCANEYGGVCTVVKPKCDICVAKECCNK
jgi:endonuclease III